LFHRPSAKRAARFAAVALPTLAIGLLVAGNAEARPPADKADHAQRFEKRLQRLDKRVRKQLAPKLGIDEATTNQLVEIFQDRARSKRDAHMEMRGEMEKLQQLVDDGAGDAALDTQLARITKLRADMPERGAALDDTARILTPTQQAKLVLLAPKVMRRGMRGHHGMRGKRGMRGMHGPRGDRTAAPDAER